VAVGRNNWIFFGSDQGGHTGAVLRSFVASCQRVRVDPFAWSNDVSRIAAHPITRLAELLPHNWKPAQSRLNENWHAAVYHKTNLTNTVFMTTYEKKPAIGIHPQQAK
jgi:hypothetical protein